MTAVAVAVIGSLTNTGPKAVLTKGVWCPHAPAKEAAAVTAVTGISRPEITPGAPDGFEVVLDGIFSVFGKQTRCPHCYKKLDS